MSSPDALPAARAVALQSQIRNHGADVFLARRGVRAIRVAAAVMAGLLACVAPSAAVGQAAPVPEKKSREVFVPFTDLKVLLDGNSNRVLLTRQQYDELLKKSKKALETHAPHPAVLTSSEYDIAVEEGRARIRGLIAVDVLEDGVFALPLDLGGVGLMDARLDGNPASLGYDSAGQLKLLFSGKGPHRLTLDLVAPVEMTAARQFLRCRLTNAAVSRWRMTVPGDVEIKAGGEVVSRVVDKQANATRFELLPRAGEAAIEMSLNSHLQRREQAVASRCIVIDEVTDACERLHATVNFWVLHRATDRLRFFVPEGFEIAEVSSPLLARWDVSSEGGRNIVNVRLREQTIDAVSLSVLAVRSPSRLKSWSLPRLEILDVVSQVSLVGLVVQDDFKAESLRAEELIPIDTAALAAALPASLKQAEAPAARRNFVAAYYAPQSRYELRAEFVRPQPTLSSTTNLLLSVREKGCEVQGGFLLVPTTEKRFSFDFAVPAGWNVTEVLGADGKPLPMERHGNEKQAGRIHVKLPQGIPPGQAYAVRFSARYTPPGWLAAGKPQPLAFPMFTVLGVDRDEGAVAVVVEEDIEVRPEKLVKMIPIVDEEKARYGLAAGVAALAYRYEGGGAEAALAVESRKPRATARTFAFFKVLPEGIQAHYELLYDIEDAKTRRLALLLPDSTPEALSIRGSGGAIVKEFVSEPAGEFRRWNVLLGDACRGEVRLIVEFQMRAPPTAELPPIDEANFPLPAQEDQKPAAPKPDASGKVVEVKDFVLPLAKADGVAYQSGLVAVEGDAELDVEVKTDARRADVGQLAPAEYPLGRRLLGAYGFVGELPKVSVSAYRNPSYGLAPVIVERAALKTLLAADGTSQTQADFRLRTKGLYLEVELPEGAALWSAVLDGTPLKPQKKSGVRLLGLPPGAAGAGRELQLVYETPAEAVLRGGRMQLHAPKLRYRAGRDARQSTDLPLVNVQWKVTVPAGYEVVDTTGTLEPSRIERPMPAPLVVAGGLFMLGGGFSPAALVGGRCAAAPKRAAPKPATTASADAHAWDSDVGGGRGPARAESLWRGSASNEFDDGERTVKEELKKVAEKAVDKKDSGRPAADEDRPAAPKAEPALEKESAEASRPTIPAPVVATPAPAKPAEPSYADVPQGEKGKSFSYVAPMTKFKQGKLQGVRSLKIDVQQTAIDEPQLITFNGLGADSHLSIALAHRNRTDALTWGIGLVVFLFGTALTRRPVRQKAALIIALGLAAALLPLAWDTLSVVKLCNAVFYAVSLLVPYYLLAGAARWIAGKLGGLAERLTARKTAAAAVLLAAFLGSATAWAQTPPAAPEPPVAVPADAVIVPYDSKKADGREKADRVLIPYDRFIELSELLKKTEQRPAPLPFALSGVSYSAVLEGEESLTLTGRMQIDVLTDEFVVVPLAVGNGVLARAVLDGKPAQLRVVAAPPGAPVQGKGGKAIVQDRTNVLLQVSGKGSHALELEVRLKLARIGGWRGTAGVLPTAPAATVAFRVPRPQTEVRLGLAVDRRSRETVKADEVLETALGPGGALQLQWRPKVAEAQIDRGLTAETFGLLDVREDGIRLAVRARLDFRHGQRDGFTVVVPVDFLVEKVAGENIRGWEVRRAGGEQSIEISLLKAAKETEQFNLFLSRSGRVGVAPLDSFAVPNVAVRDAALSSGQLIIRRSPLLDVRTTERSGVTRIDLGPLPDLSGGPATEESVLAIRPYEAYRFPTMPFSLKLAAAPIAAEVTAEAQTCVKVDPARPTLESRVVFRVGHRSVYRLEIAVPDDLRLPEVVLPGGGQWTIEKQGKQSVLRAELTQGLQGDVPLIVRGKLSPLGAAREMPLPQLVALGVRRQEGDVAVQVDPAFNVETRDLAGCQEAALEKVSAWLDPQLRALTRSVLHYSGPVYSGRLRLAARVPEVACDTITNVRVTDRTIEDTIILNYTIHNAGIREVAFLLPAWMRDARISTPMLRRKSIEPIDGKADSPLRVRLELQGDVMNELRVLVENDRLLTSGSHVAPLPSFETDGGRTADFVRRQYVVLESANRDELVVEPLAGMERLARQQQQWQLLAGLLGGRQFHSAYQLRPGGVPPKLSFHVQAHEELQTAGARIDLAQTTVIVDAAGAYRAKVEFTLDNSAEQFLDVELPGGATLWTVHVAGEPVKPVRVPGKSDRHVLLPVLKTAKGDLNYPVVLKYGGRLPPLSAFTRVDVPLVRNVTSHPRGGKIGVERSQVELYVPKSHSWYAFGGTLHPTEDEAELRAGRVAALNKQGQRLIEAANDKDPFARVRATENLKNWALEAEKAQVEGSGSRNTVLLAEIGQNSGTLAQAKDLLKAGGDQQPPTDGTAADNRDQLNDSYRQQGTTNASGTLVLSGNNSYTGGTTVVAGTLSLQNPAKNPVDFNGNWIARNNLAVQSDAASIINVNPNAQIALPNQPGESGPQQQAANQPITQTIQPGQRPNFNFTEGNTYSGTATVNGGVILTDRSAAIAPNLPPGGPIQTGQSQFGGIMPDGGSGGQGWRGQAAWQQAGQQTILQRDGRMPQSRRGGADAQQKELAQYQQKLSIANAGVADQFNEGRKLDVDEAAKREKSAPVAKSGDESGAAENAPAEMPPAPPLAGPGAATTPAVQAGLASLDFELPADKDLYRIYRFTTPRGEAELTARALNNQTAWKLAMLFGIAAVVLVLRLAIRLLVRGGLSWLGRPVGSTCLTLAGAALMIVGFLPLFGLIAFLAGGYFLAAGLWRRWRKTVAAAA